MRWQARQRTGEFVVLLVGAIRILGRIRDDGAHNGRVRVEPAHVAPHLGILGDSLCDYVSGARPRIVNRRYISRFVDVRAGQ